MPRKRSWSLLWIAFVVSATLSAGAHAASGQVEVGTVMKKVYPALVRIYTVSARHAGGREVKGMSSGSGVIISPDGYVVTNHHVIGHATKIWCTLHNKERVDAVRIGTDAMTDVAVLKLQPESMRNPVKTFPFAEWADSDKLVVGQKVFAMGSPGAIAQSVTYGVIANPKIIMPGRGMQLDGEPVGNLVRWILHDAQIFGGNSGGPLVDVEGRVIGINEIGVAALGGAIPANTAKRVAKELIRSGSIERNWVGLGVQRLLRSDPRDDGILVNSIHEKSPADLAGLQRGDRILSVNGTPIQARFAEQMPVFHTMVLESGVGKSLAIVFERDGEKKTVNVESAPRGKAKGDDKEVLSWGVTARDLTRLAKLGARYEGSGVMISSIRPGGPAGQAKPMLHGGDIIQKVGSTAVNTMDEFLAASHAVTDGKDEAVPTLIQFWRRGESFATVVSIGPEEEPQVVPQVRKAWFPASVQVLTRTLAEGMNLKGKKGVRITRLYEVMGDAGFAVGDIITHLDLMPVDASEPQHAERFPTMIRRYKPGTEVTFKVIRDGKTTKVPYKLPPAPVPERELAKYKDKRIEFEARDLGVMDCIRRRLSPDQTGVLLEEVTSGGWAHLGGLRAGDIVLGVGGLPVKSIEDLKSHMKTMEGKTPRFVVFLLKRGIQTVYAEVEPDWTREVR